MILVRTWLEGRIFWPSAEMSFAESVLKLPGGPLSAKLKTHEQRKHRPHDDRNSAAELGDVVFQESPDWRNNARLDLGSNRWEIYAIGYMRAADILVARVLESQHELDFLIYPIVFLYRHYLELRLKELIVAGRELLDLPPDLRQVHRLDVLWVSCRKILGSLARGFFI